MLRFAVSASAFALWAAAAGDTVDAVVVTGSRALGRTVENSPAPIDLVSARALQYGDKANLLDTLATLSPSFNLPNVGGGRPRGRAARRALGSAERAERFRAGLVASVSSRPERIRGEADLGHRSAG